MQIHPFRALRPVPEQLAAVASPPYDVVSEAEARAILGERPSTFLRVVRPEITLPPEFGETAALARSVYTQGREQLARLTSEGVLRRDPEAGFYLYAQTRLGRRQIGLVAAVSVADYQQGRVKRHEFTRPDKEDDRTRHVLEIGAHTGPVFVAWRAGAELDGIVAELAGRAPESAFTSADGVLHEFWPVFEARDVERLRTAACALPALYIADGHHRAAAASRVATQLEGARHSDRFLCVLFPHTELTILAYNRLLHDWNGRDAAGLLAALAEHFEVTKVDRAPAAAGEFGVYLADGWRHLRLRGPRPSDPVAGLDVAILQDRVLAPLFGIEDPRRDPRISFVGGIRGAAGLEGPVDRREAVAAFRLYPTSMEELLSVADSGQVMPPKSTWFEPKLRSGVVVHPLEAEGA